MPTEADTCRKFTVPALQRAGWENDPHAIGEQRAITDGRIVPRGKGYVRRPPKRADYFQICWKLWNSKWNAKGDPTRKPRILFLADRNFLVNDPKDKTFAPFGDARHRIENGTAVFSREIYFSTYQSLASDERRPGLYKEFPKDFFDLVIVDECQPPATIYHPVGMEFANPEGCQIVAGGQRPPETGSTMNRIPEGCQNGR